MDLDHLRELLQLVAASDVAEVEIEEDDLKIVVRKQAPAQAHPATPPTFTYAIPPQPGYPQAVQPPAGNQMQPQAAGTAAAANQPGSESGQQGGESEVPTSQAESGTEVRAPIVGTFYEAPSPDADPFVTAGDRVEEGDVLCIIEAMKLMNEIESEVSGTLKKVLVDDATPVEYDQALFVIEED